MGCLRDLTLRQRMLAKGWAARVGYVLPPPQPADYDEAAVDTIARVRRHTMTSAARQHALIGAVEYISRAGIPGALVECGVWKGGSMMAAAITLRRLGATDRDLYLFDTYSGMVEPGIQDVDSPYDGYALNAMWRRRRRGDRNWHAVPLADVRAAMATTGYPMERVRLVEGPVEETLREHAPERIALLRLDTDWYASTAHGMAQLYPRLERGGVLLLDDYGHYPGARRAVDEHLAATAEHLLLQRIDYTGRMAVRP